MEAPVPYVVTPDAAAHRATVAAGFVTGLLSGVALRGGDRATFLDEARIDPRVLQDPALRVPIDAYVALYNRVAEALGDEAFGLFAQPMRRGAFEFLVRGAIGSPTLAEALGRMSRYLAVSLPPLAVTLVANRLEIRETQPIPPGPSRVFAFEWLLRLLHAVSCWLVARPVTLEEVRFPFAAPRHAADYVLVYTEHPAFGGDALVATFHASALQLPLRRTDADVTAFLEGAPGKIGLLYRRDREVARDARSAIARSLASSPTLDAVAAELGLSSRTLHRRLEEEGTSFRKLKDAVRRDAAMTRLGKGTESVAEVASALGYSEPSAFFRAFRTWTGEAPSTHRRRDGRRRLGSK
jgi:AraC-like DNA-binding protein